MATTTATLMLTSSDLFDDQLSLSTTKNCYKAGTTIGLDQTTGLAKTYLTATTELDIFPTLVEGSLPYTGKTSKVYIANLSTTDTEYITVKISASVIGRLYAGDWMWMPWSQAEDSHGNNYHGDIQITPSVATGMWVEFMSINEGIQYPTVNTAIT